MAISLHAKDVTSPWFADGKFIEESERQRMTNGFGGRLDFTDDPNFLQNWRTQWNSVSSVQHPGWVYVVLFVASNYESQDQDAVYGLTVKQPDSSVCIHFTNLLAAKLQIHPPAIPHDTRVT